MHHYIKNEYFQQLVRGAQTDLFVLSNSQNTVVAITNYGARIVSVKVPNAEGTSTDIVVGYNSIEEYLNATEVYHGAVVGRYANRIANGKFSIGERRYTLAQNNFPNHLHGGQKGFHQAIWTVVQQNSTSVTLRYFSADGEEGYPGNLHLSVTYSLTEANELRLTFEATTDKDTIVNLTNHSYFNLNGVNSGTILHHLLQINADYFTPVDGTSIPLGNLAAVKGSPFDFTESRTIGKSIGAKHLQLIIGDGYDHNFVLNKSREHELSLAATAVGDKSGIKMEVFTTEPGLQLYTGKFSPRKAAPLENLEEERRSAFCLETQHFPDSPNHPNFPSTVLKRGDVFHSQTIFKLSTIA